MLYEDYKLCCDISAVTRSMVQTQSRDVKIQDDDVTRDANDVNVNVDAVVNEINDCDDDDSFINPDKVENVLKFNVNGTYSLIDEQKNEETLKSSFALARQDKVDLLFTMIYCFMLDLIMVKQ